MMDLDTLKRTRDEYEKDQGMDDDDDDNVSLVSRSPSPVPMDVDSRDMFKYDEYVRGYVAPEPITVDTRISSENKGFSMLSKLGWTEGTPLGLTPDARVDPIPFQIKYDGTGIGKIAQDARVIAETVAQRKEMDSVRQQNETEDQRRHREEKVARQSNLKTEISATLRAFYCELCDKQFKTVAQYDEHTNSYAHHHKARAKDMQANVRIKNQADVNKAKEKERKREEKELRKMAAAAGITMPSTLASSTSAPKLVATGMEPKLGGGFKKSGWSAVTTQASRSSLHCQPCRSTPMLHFPPPPTFSSSSGLTPPLSPPSDQPQPPPPDNSGDPPVCHEKGNEPHEATVFTQPAQTTWQQFQNKAHKRR